MSWRIAETASEIEKIKSESADYLNGLNSCGVIDWNTYDYAFDFYADLLMKAYEQGWKDAEPEIITCENCKHGDVKPIADGRRWCNRHSTYMYYCSDAERREDEPKRSEH